MTESGGAAPSALGEGRWKKRLIAGWQLLRELSTLGFQIILLVVLLKQLTMGWGGWTVLVVLSIGTAVAAFRFPRVWSFLCALWGVLKALVDFVVELVLACVPAGIVYGFSRWVTEELPVDSRRPLLVTSFLLLAAMSWLIYSPRQRARLFELLRPFGGWLPLTFSVTFLFVAIAFFAATAHTILQAATDAPVPDHGLLADYFLWHFLDAIPMLDVTTTLDWRRPLAEGAVPPGWLVLIFKIMVIVPIIAATGAWLKRRASDPAPATESSDQAAS